jgi:predicted nucleotidyltransferase
MDKEQVIKLVQAYKQAILPTYKDAKVYLYGSYSKGTAHQDSDIDVAIVVPQISGNWFNIVPPLWSQARKISSLIEPVIMQENEHSPLYDDVMRTGLAV